jgi:uncharacterized protein with HEPN domain
MVVEAEYLISRSAALDFDGFMSDDDLRRAFVRALEIIGEATRKLDKDFRGAHSAIEWRAIAGTRDKLIHEYEGVDYQLVWDMVRTDIPPFLEQIRAILADRASRRPANER